MTFVSLSLCTGKGVCCAVKGVSRHVYICVNVFMCMHVCVNI